MSNGIGAITAVTAAATGKTSSVGDMAAPQILRAHAMFI